MGREAAEAFCPNVIAAPPTSVKFSFCVPEGEGVVINAPEASVCKGCRLPDGLMPATSVEDVGAVLPLVPTDGLAEAPDADGYLKYCAILAADLLVSYIDGCCAGSSYG